MEGLKLGHLVVLQDGATRVCLNDMLSIQELFECPREPRAALDMHRCRACPINLAWHSGNWRALQHLLCIFVRRGLG